MARWLAGGKTCKTEVVQNQLLSTSDAFKHQTRPMVVIPAHQIRKRARSGRFGLILDLGVTHDRAKCLPVRLKSCGSVFSSFLSYILVLDLSGLFRGVLDLSGLFRAGGRAGGRVKAEWPVGWPVANVSNGSCPKSTSINIRRFQTSN